MKYERIDGPTGPGYWWRRDGTGVMRVVEVGPMASLSAMREWPGQWYGPKIEEPVEVLPRRFRWREGYGVEIGGRYYCFQSMHDVANVYHESRHITDFQWIDTR